MSEKDPFFQPDDAFVPDPPYVNVGPEQVKHPFTGPRQEVSERIPRNKRYTEPELFPDDSRSGLGKFTDDAYDFLARAVNDPGALLNEHPKIKEFGQRALYGSSPESEQQRREENAKRWDSDPKIQKDIPRDKYIEIANSTQGPGLMEIPGTKKVAEVIKGLGDKSVMVKDIGTQGHPVASNPDDNWAVGAFYDLASQIAEMAGSGFDPRTAGIKALEFPWGSSSPLPKIKPIPKGLPPHTGIIVDEFGNAMRNEPVSGPLGPKVEPAVALDVANVEAAEPRGTTLNEAEYAEAQRQAALEGMTTEEWIRVSQGLPRYPWGSSSPLPPRYEPPLSGDTSLGFQPQASELAEGAGLPSEGLPYPLNVIPNRLRPREVQAETLRKLPEILQPKVAQEAGAKTVTLSDEGITARPAAPYIEPELPSAREIREQFENETGAHVTSEQQAKMDAVLKESPIPEVKPVQTPKGNIRLKPIVPTERPRSEILKNDPIYQAAKEQLRAAGQLTVPALEKLGDAAVARAKAADAAVNKPPPAPAAQPSAPKIKPITPKAEPGETFLRGDKGTLDIDALKNKLKSIKDEEFQQIWDNLVKMLGREPTDKEFMTVVRKGNKSAFSPTGPKGNLFEGSEGTGLGKAPFDQQWQEAISEAKQVGINPAEYDNLDSLQWDITRKVAQIVAEGGENPLRRNPESGVMSVGRRLIKDESGELKLRGIKKEDVAKVRAAILDHLVNLGRPDVERIWKTFDGSIKRSQYDKIIDDIIESGDLRNLAQQAKEKGYVGDTNPPPMSPPTPAADALDALLSKVKEHVVARNEQDILVREEKYRRITNAREANTSGIGGHYATLRELRGEYPKVSVADLMDGINPADIDAIKNQIYEDPNLDFFAKVNATNAFLKAIGKMPSRGALQPGEISLLDAVFGSNLTDDLIEMHGGLGFGNSEAFKNFVQMGNDYKTLKSAWDMGWPFRQGKFYAGTKAWKEAVVRSTKSYFSERLGEGQMAELRGKPRYSMWLDEGLSLSDFHSKRAALRDEAVPSDVGSRLSQTGSDLYNLKQRLGSNGFLGAVDSTLGKIAGTPMKVAGWGVNASDRAITVGMDHLRIDNANRLYDAFDRHYNAAKEMAEARGASAKEIADLEELNPANPFRLQKIIKLVNDSTARGKLPFGMERSAEFWNTLLYSPKMRSGNMRTLGKLLNPKGWQKMTAIEKKLAVQQVASMAAVTASAWGLSKFMQHVMGHKVEAGVNATSSDFGKQIIDDKTRLDPMGGLSQIVVPLAQIMTGETTSSTSDKTRKLGSFGGGTGTGIMEQMLIDKQLAPIGSLTAALMNRSEIGGRPLDFQSANPFENTATRSLINPMIFQDIYDMFQSDPSLIPFLIGPDAMGMNVTTYQDIPKDKSIKFNNFNKEFQDSLRGGPTMLPSLQPIR